MHWFEELPWWAKSLLIIGGALMSAFSNSFPPGFQLFGLYLGIALSLAGVMASTWHWLNQWRVRRGKPRVKLEPSHLISIGLIGGAIFLSIAAAGYAWQTFWPSAKVNAAQGIAASAPVRSGPVFTTQYGREKFRSALDDLAGVVNSHVGEVIRLSNNVAGVHPLVGIGRGRGAIEPEEKLKQISEKYKEAMDSYAAFFDRYPIYRQDFTNLLPAQNQWNAYHKALNNFMRSVYLIREAERYPADTKLFEVAIASIDPVQEQFIQATNSLKEWVDLVNQKIAELAKAS
jgi:hypothetical protein